MGKKTGAVLLCLALVLSLLAGGQTSYAAEKGKKSKSQEINWLIQEKLLTKPAFPNYKKILDNPEKKITREEFITLLVKTMNYGISKKTYASMEYADKKKVKSSYQAYYGKAEQYGILAFDSQTKLMPGKKLTKQAAAFYLGKLTGAADYMPLEYSDCKTVSDAGIYIKGLTAIQVLPSKNTTKYDPEYKFTWSDAASLIKKAEETGLFEKTGIRVFAGNFIKPGTTESEFLNPTDIIMDSAGVIYIADTGHNCIKKIENGVISVVAGRSFGKDMYGQEIGGYRDDVAASALFNKPSGLCITQDGTILVSDTGNNVIRMIKDGIVMTYAGTSEEGYLDGKKEEALFSSPKGITAAPDGTIYVADSMNNRIRKITADGMVSTEAGGGLEGCQDARTADATFMQPSDVLFENGILYVADTGSHRIRKIENGKVSTLAGGGNEVYEDGSGIIGAFQDGKGINTRFNAPVSLASDGEGTLYVTDSINRMIRKIAKDGTVTTIAGFGKLAVDKGEMEPDYLYSPSGIIYLDGSLLVSDSFCNLLYEVEGIK